MKTTFRNDSYINSHGKNPKGFGRWIFEVVFSDCLGSYCNGEMIEATGTFAAAKKSAKQQALAEAKTIGTCREVFLDVQG
jgi:hypothetical protein